MRTREEEREDRRRYEGDVEYEVWRRGGNPDRVDRERVTDAWYDGSSVDEVTARELERLYPEPEVQP